MATDVHEEIHSHKAKVVIIGAGISGISAAEYLSKNGFNDFKIIEASDRVGGRIWTHDIGKKGENVDQIWSQENHENIFYIFTRFT